MLGVLAVGRVSKRHFLMRYILEKGATPNGRVEIENNVPVLTAAAGYSDRKMVELLLDYGAQISGNGALIFAAECGNVENVECLLAQGPDVNEMLSLSSTKSGQEKVGRALHKAAENGHTTIVDLLLDAGADVNIKNARGRTAADIALRVDMNTNVLARLW